MMIYFALPCTFCLAFTDRSLAMKPGSRILAWQSPSGYHQRDVDVVKLSELGRKLDRG
jgi:hypothetical protein